MANKVVETYDAGRIAEAMAEELSIRTAISTLNALYEHSTHQRRFYKDLSPIFGDDYVFTQKDLRISTMVDNPCILYRNLDKTPEVIYYVCITTIVLSVLSKAVQTKQIKHKNYKLIARKYLSERFMEDVIQEQVRRKESGVNMPTVSKTLAKSENERIHPTQSLLRRRKTTPKSTKHRPWVHIIYTPMGNKR